MTETAREKALLMPELPAKQPWSGAFTAARLILWQGTLAVCCKRRMVLSPKAHYDRRATAGSRTTTAGGSPTGAPNLLPTSWAATPNFSNGSRGTGRRIRHDHGVAAGHHQPLDVALGDVGPGQEQLAHGPAVAVLS